MNLTPNNIGQLRKLNSVVFPVRYPEAFYKDVLADNVRDFCKLAYYQSTCVGAICCKVVPPAKDGKDSKPSLYIQCLVSIHILRLTLKLITIIGRAGTLPTSWSGHIIATDSDESGREE